MNEPSANLGWEHIWRDQRSHWEFLEPEAEVLELMSRLKSEDKRRVHDLGCGVGRHLLAFAAEGFDTYGSDVSPTAIETCRRRLRDSGLNATVTLIEINDRRLSTGPFDAVVAWNVLYHNTADLIAESVKGVWESLNEGGYFLATFISTAGDEYTRSREALAKGQALELDPDTFVIPGDTASDKALPHHYSTDGEIRERFLAGFDILRLDDHRAEDVDFEGRPRKSAHWHVLAQRKKQD